MQCYNPVALSKRAGYPTGLLVPCGKCLACRIRSQAEWSLRMLHELHSFKYEACFITLTYDPEYLPMHMERKFNKRPYSVIAEAKQGTLLKSDLQKFFKRLRKRFKDKKIKYFGCGEYGDPNEGNRPHYHAIVFGLDNTKKNEEIITKIWGKGFVVVGDAESKSIKYVTKYIQKKYSGKKEEEEYILNNRENVFRLISLGIGKDYAISIEKQLRDNLTITMNGVKMAIPRYYVKLLDLDREKLKLHAEKKELDENEKIFGIAHSDIEIIRMALTDLSLGNNELYLKLYEEKMNKKEAYKKQSEKNKIAAQKIKELKQRKRL